MESSLFTLERILPEQFGPEQKGLFQGGGIQALMCAILEDAIYCFQKQFGNPGQEARRLAAEAEEWLFTDDLEWIFSFLNICQALGLDPGYVRAGLRNWYECPPTVRWQRSRSAVQSGPFHGTNARQSAQSLLNQPRQLVNGGQPD